MKENKDKQNKKIEYYTVDRIEEEIVVLENRDTLEKENINLKKLPKGIKQGIILKKINNVFFIDMDKTEKVAKRLNDKMKNLIQ